MTKLLLKDVWNRCVNINGVRVCSVQWLQNPYMIVEPNATFEQVSERTYKPYFEFHTLKELNDAIKK